eukprot:gene39493-48800_t
MPSSYLFKDRKDAARQLAQRLEQLRLHQPLILAIPRGAIPIGAVLARQLRGELDVAQALNREALCLARAHGSLLLEALLELDHAQLLEQRGAPYRAQSLLEGVQAMLIQQRLKTGPLMGRIALRRGHLALRQGHDALATECLEAGLGMCLHSQDKRVLYGFLGLAMLAANRGDYAQ